MPWMKRTGRFVGNGEGGTSKGYLSPCPRKSVSRMQTTDVEERHGTVYDE